MNIENCVICGKYLRDIGEEENGMCDPCNREADKVSRAQLKEEEKKKPKGGTWTEYCEPCGMISHFSESNPNGNCLCV